MIDLHSHILFDIDDGAKDLEDTVEILKTAESIGIKKIMATPHFSVGDDVDSFIKKRGERMAKVSETAMREEINIEIKPGAEVYITDELFNEEDLKKLTLGGGDFILTEFKYHAVKPERFLEYVDYIKEEGLKVIIAHIERYSFVRKTPLLIDALKSRGVLLQVNAISLFEESEEGDFAYMLFKNRAIDILASDVHSVPSKRYAAIQKLLQSENEYTKKLLFDNPLEIF